MDKMQIRTEKLRRLVAEEGGPAEFARKRSRTDADKPIDPTYISQILNGHRSFGERAAENMISRAGLPVGFFDAPIADQLPSVQKSSATEIPPRLQSMIDKLLMQKNNIKLIKAVESVLNLAEREEKSDIMKKLRDTKNTEHRVGAVCLPEHASEDSVNPKARTGRRKKQSNG